MSLFGRRRFDFCNINKFVFLLTVVHKIFYQEFDLFLLMLLATDSVSAMKEISNTPFSTFGSWPEFGFSSLLRFSYALWTRIGYCRWRCQDEGIVVTLMRFPSRCILDVFVLVVQYLLKGPCIVDVLKSCVTVVHYRTSYMDIIHGHHTRTLYRWTLYRRQNRQPSKSNMTRRKNRDRAFLRDMKMANTTEQSANAKL